MAKSYSLDLREKVAAFVDRGHACREAARVFGVSPSFVVKLMARRRLTGSLSASARGGTGRHGRQAVSASRVPDCSGRGSAGSDDAGVGGPSAGRAWRDGGAGDAVAVFDPLRADAQKKTLLASEQRRPDVAAERQDWCACRQPRMRAEPGRLIFLDETSVKTNLTRRHGRCPKGRRLRADTPFGKWRTQTFIAGLKLEGIVAPFVIHGAMNGAAFDAYVRTQLAPAVRPGDIVVLDNLNVHKSPRAAAALAERGAWFLFLPRYSPDLNPIEMAFAKLKAHLKPAPTAPSTPSGAPSAKSATCSHHRNAETISKPQDMPSNERPVL